MKLDNTYKGTNIIIGNQKRQIINKLCDYLIQDGYTEIQLPIIQYKEVFKDKIGDNNNMMFTVKEHTETGRDLCLAPEYTAVVKQLATGYYKHKKDVKLFYVQECFRGERPQAGRYRQFTQLGIEILNPTQDWDLGNTALNMLYLVTNQAMLDENLFELNCDVTRGLDYYKEGKGFEITCDKLGSSKQICGGGDYDNGTGFAIGIDRLMLLYDK